MSNITLDKVYQLRDVMGEALDAAEATCAGVHDLQNASKKTRKQYFYAAYTYYKALRIYKEQTGQELWEVPAYEQGFYESWLNA